MSGDPSVTAYTRLVNRFEKKFTVDPDTLCWVWHAALTGGGYGYFWYRHRMVMAHTMSLFLAGYTLPAGFDPDHKCRNRPCVNPAHLEPVTRSENVRRGIGPTLLRVRTAAVTHCPQGHPYSRENTYLTPRGARSCRECRRSLNRERRRMRVIGSATQ